MAHRSLRHLQTLDQDHNDEIKAVTFKNAPENLKLTSPDIQKDIISVAAFETINIIINEIGDGLFSILVDESHDISVKEQISIVLLYVNKKGCVVERFVGIKHVSSTTALSLKDAIDNLFSRYKLSISSLRGQDYDGASNMQAVANKHVEIEAFFDLVDRVVNVVGGSAKRCDLLRKKQRLQILEALSHGEISSGWGLNQQTTLKHFGDTRWGSHYGSLLNLIHIFSPTIDVLGVIANDVPSSEKIGESCNLLNLIITFDFAFSLYLMKKILGMSNELSKALQKKDQDFANVMRLVKICKEQLQAMRDNEWNSFLETIYSFCQKHSINVPNMDDTYKPPGRSRCNTPKMTNLHHLQIDFFYAVIDMQLQELNDRFSEVNSELCLL
ncbi:uncharacterized protein LOC127812456 [Diospyros lotus]|uniref:uncharacterized protein LOC127812456 n=1 Tax=Diospyros lotus TaxID=55363 RepID=UPI00224ED5B6|nr:uncharacterized protein LOC127812456 [Diospyros lotus]